MRKGRYAQTCVFCEGKRGGGSTAYLVLVLYVCCASRGSHKWLTYKRKWILVGMRLPSGVSRACLLTVADGGSFRSVSPSHHPTSQLLTDPRTDPPSPPRLFLFSMMVNFLKGYHIFIRPPDSVSGEEDIYDDAAAPVAGGSAAAVGRAGGGGDSGGGGGGGGGCAGQGQESDVEFDVLGFLAFSEADLRPFLRVLLRTKAFAAFLAGAR